MIYSRWVLTPRQLFSGDSVNFAYSVGKFDTRISQPQPPGYPVFVMEMRVLDFLRVKRAESNLAILALLSTGAALWLAIALGNRMFGGRAGLWAGFLLLFYPSFWLAGLTSPVRVQLAVVSLGVAGACWMMVEGRRNWRYWSALALGVGAGIRPDLGPLLMPLWLWTLFRAERRWLERWKAMALLAGTVFAWLLPAAYASGGLVTYFRNSWFYLADQVSLAPTALDDTSEDLIATAARMLVWVCSGIPTLALPAVLAWRSGEGFGLSRWTSFLAWWFVPLAAFAVSVHLADPGHASSMVPVICLAGGRLIDTALEKWPKDSSQFQAIGLALALVLMVIFAFAGHLWQAVGMPLAGLAAGWILRTRWRPTPGIAAGAAVLLLAPILLNLAIFFQPFWSYDAPAGAAGIRATAERFWSRVNIEVYALSMALVRRVTDFDDQVLTRAREWTAQKPGNTAIVWVNGITDWRKVTYYLPGTSVYVVTHTTPSPQTPTALVLAKGPDFRVIEQGASPLHIRAAPGSRLIWILNEMVEPHPQWIAELEVFCEGQVCRTDLPREPGSFRTGNAEITWGSRVSEANAR